MYVCEYNSFKIVKLNCDLETEKSFELNYFPWYIKILNDIVCVRVRPAIIECLHFYDLNFNEIRKYESHSGIIGVNNHGFLEYYSKNKTFYCYDKKGKLREEIKINNTEFFGDSIYIKNGIIRLSTSKLYICCNAEEIYLFSINYNYKH